MGEQYRDQGGSGLDPEERPHQALWIGPRSASELSVAVCLGVCWLSKVLLALSDSVWIPLLWQESQGWKWIIPTKSESQTFVHTFQGFVFKLIP